MVQVQGSGAVKDTDEMRGIIRSSFDVETFEPQNVQEWNFQYDKYEKIVNEYRGN